MDYSTSRCGTEVETVFFFGLIGDEWRRREGGRERERERERERGCGRWVVSGGCEGEGWEGVGEG